MFSSLISPDNIIFNLQSTDKDELFSELVEFLVRKNPSIDRDEALKALENREEVKNTQTAPGIAVPHACLSSINKTEIVLGISRAGIDYEITEGHSLKDNLVHFVILILFNAQNTEAHLHLLSDCALILNTQGFYPEVLKASDANEVYSMIKEAEYGRLGS